MHRLLSVFLFALSLPAAMQASGKSDLNKSEQCLVVLTENWDATKGVLRAFERSTATGAWNDRGSAVPVVVGKKGLGEGAGLIGVEFKGAPRKKEGDNKAPAGIFRLSSAFGYAPRRSARWIKLPYLALSKTIEGVDDPKSRFYTQLVDRSKIPHPDWHSSEQMLRNDVLYKWGIVVDHNARAIPGAGSCIFLHIWKDSATATAGCTAMREKDLVTLLRWLDPKRRPVLIQMPRAEYARFRPKYKFPREH
jgi:L,D-peptidoglycan transpeptidase YkuD (ErfK/YbiS/YcfS/YnhG family)